METIENNNQPIKSTATRIRLMNTLLLTLSFLCFLGVYNLYNERKELFQAQDLAQ